MEDKFSTKKKIERTILIGIHIKGKKRENFWESLKELEQLAITAGILVIEKILVSKNYIDSKFVIGTGKAKEILEYAKANDVQVIIVDEQLSPVQERNLRKYFQIKVLDRVELILDIFAKHANTHESKIQIELAQLKYLLPRLTRMWVHLSRQIGGVGVRGPGETQIEIDRRRIREKIHLHKNKLEEIRKIRELQRQSRVKSNLSRVCLIGYTNAGKSSILNSLTGANAVVEDQLFCTLDSMSRKLDLPNNRTIVISDTVGFIRNLPHFLVEAFKSTLEEVIEADLLLNVIDGTDENIDNKMLAVEDVLIKELNIRDKS
ncbi:GTPase HflX, partial [bacterium B13(2017)]